MNLRSRSLAVFAMVGLLTNFVPSAFVRAETVAASPGDLIRGTTFSAVYYMGEDGFRYVFPNDKTYFTWYSDFSAVKMLSDADLATIQMGGNVTYRPGVKMIKINSDPKVYFVTAGGVLRWVSTETDAEGMYGAQWNTMIDDVPDGFFGNYTIGDVLDLSTVTSGPASVPSATQLGTPSITDDKGLTAFAEVSIENMMFGGGDSDQFTIAAGQTMKFINNDAVSHTATADDDSWGTGTMKEGQSFVRRFSTSGTYTFHCSYHPDMTGTIVVTAAETM